MGKLAGLYSVAMLVGMVSVSAGAIQSINVSQVASYYSASNKTLTLSGAADIKVEDTWGNQTTFANGSFSMATTLAADLSAGGIASGQFAGGSLAFLDSGDNILLSGNVQTFKLVEVFDNCGIMAGEGQFLVTGGSLLGDFALSCGEFVQLTYQIVPSTLFDFSADFYGTSNLTITPVYFLDPNFKAAVEDALGITDPTPTDMLRLTFLDASNRGITDITGIGYAVNLTTLYLDFNQLSSLSPEIGNLTNLLYLYLSGNPLNTEAYCDIIPLIINNNPGIDISCDPNPNPLTNDCSIDIPDLTNFSILWLESDCGVENNWCNGADLNHINNVDMKDIAIFTKYWLAEVEP